MKISENVPIAELTTMRLGGVARYVVEIERPEDIAAALLLRENGICRPGLWVKEQTLSDEMRAFRV